MALKFPRHHHGGRRPRALCQCINPAHSLHRVWRSPSFWCTFCHAAAADVWWVGGMAGFPTQHGNQPAHSDFTEGQPCIYSESPETSE